MVPAHLCHNLYGIRWSNRQPLGCSCQAVNHGYAKDLGCNQQPRLCGNIRLRSVSQGT
jgi:hypothetical protein